MMKLIRLHEQCNPQGAFYATVITKETDTVFQNNMVPKLLISQVN